MGTIKPPSQRRSFSVGTALGADMNGDTCTAGDISRRIDTVIGEAITWMFSGLSINRDNRSRVLPSTASSFRARITTAISALHL
jgi:hypothetical protein